jgi:hypothetical protein
MLINPNIRVFFQIPLLRKEKLSHFLVLKNIYEEDEEF